MHLIETHGEVMLIKKKSLRGHYKHVYIEVKRTITKGV